MVSGHMCDEGSDVERGLSPLDRRADPLGVRPHADRRQGEQNASSREGPVAYLTPHPNRVSCARMAGPSGCAGDSFRNLCRCLHAFWGLPCSA